jgi:hypothetical protein
VRRIKILGLSLIVLSWIFWGMILCVPFLKLGIRESAFAITALFIGTNIFWVGVMLVGNDFLKKYKIGNKIKKWVDGLNFK